MIRRMRVLLKLLLGVLVLGIIGLGGAWIWAGRMEGPRIDVRQPQKFVGQAGTLDMMVEAPRGELSRLDAVLEQGGKSYPVYARETGERTRTSQQNADQLWISRPIGKKDIPALKSGPARIVIRAAHLIEQGKSDDREAIRKALDGHICRCTGYGRIIDAIQTAGEALRNGLFGLGLGTSYALLYAARQPPTRVIEAQNVLDDSPAS